MIRSLRLHPIQAAQDANTFVASLRHIREFEATLLARHRALATGLHRGCWTPVPDHRAPGDDALKVSTGQG